MFLSADQDYMPTTYVEAKALGLSMYFTGKSCLNGHTTSRYASSKECFYCRQIKNSNPELKKKQKEASLKSKEKINARARERYQSNKQFEKLRSHGKWINNKEAIIARNKDWESRNYEKALSIYKSRNAVRKHRIKEQCPKWADKAKIREIYFNCPKGHHVDHILPLKGKNVCGFHVENNLQYLTASENCKKHNKFIGE